MKREIAKNQINPFHYFMSMDDNISDCIFSERMFFFLVPHPIFDTRIEVQLI